MGGEIGLSWMPDLGLVEIVSVEVDFMSTVSKVHLFEIFFFFFFLFVYLLNSFVCFWIR